MRWRNSTLTFMGAVVIVGALGSCAAEPHPAPTSDTASSSEYRGTPSEYSLDMAKCMSERGVPAEATTTDEGESVVAAKNVGPGTAERLQEASQECALEIGYPPVPSTEAELREVYVSIVTQNECLNDADWPTPRPPSFQSFVDQVNGGEVTYDPYSLIPAGSLDDARAGCPRDWTKWW